MPTFRQDEKLGTKVPLIKTDDYNDQSVTEKKLKDGNITTRKLSDCSVTTAKIADGNVTTQKIADQNVTTGKLQDSGVTTEKIADLNVTTEKLDDKSVTTEKMADGSVSNEKLQDDSITNEKLAENSITKDKLKDNTIGVEKLDPELRQTINAATGLTENLVETIQNVDDTLKDHQIQLDDKQSQIDDKQQQITSNDEDISLLQTRSTQMEETIKSIAATGGASQATAVTYNNDASGLNAVNAQAAIDEVSSMIIYDVSAHNNGAVFESLQALLSSSNLSTLIPTSVRHGGMSIRFIQGSDNKYIQARLMADSFTTDVTQWQGVDDEPTAGSPNLVTSGGVAGYVSVSQNTLTIGELGTAIHADSKIALMPSSVIDNSAINADGSINTNVSFLSKVVVFSLPNAESVIDLSIPLPNYTSPYLSGALYDGNGNVVKLLETIWIANYTYRFLIYNNFGATTLKVCVNDTKVDDLVATINKEVIRGPLTNDSYGNYDLLSYTQKDDNSLINADGTIGTSSQYYSGRSVLHFNAKKDHIYNIKFVSSDNGTPYIMGAVYKNGSPVLLLPPYWVAGVIERNLVVNTMGLDADEIIISVKTTEVGKVLFAQSAEVIWSDNKDNIAYGAYTLLTRDSYTANSAINADGTIATDSQWLTAGVVSSYSISEDRIYKLHFKVPAFSNSFRAIVLRKNEMPILVFAPLNGTASEVDFVLDTRGIDADELLICEYVTTSGTAIVSESAPLLYAQGLTKNIDAIYNAMNGADIYTISQTGGKFGLIPRLFIEGLAKSDNGSVININGGDSLILEHPDYVNTDDTNHTFSFAVNADGYASMMDRVTIHKHSPANAKNKAMRIMCIGDSLTDAGYAGVVEFIFKALNQDYGNNDINALMVGTKSDAANLTLGNYSFTVRGFNEGRSGWAISDYLRHFDVVTSNKLNWDLLGLGTMTRNGITTRTYESYTGSDTQKELMRTTCHGWYDADPSEELWTWLKTDIYSSVFSDSFVYDGVTYDLGSSYSSNADAAIVAAVKLICSSSTLWKPCPFYDYDTVQSSNGKYAFNLETYLNRYKTIDSDGTTRLVAGSTAGTWVNNVNNYDVCTPTHVVIIMNENDARWISSGTPVADDLKLCADLVEAYDNTIKISIGSTRGYGAFRPSSYNSYGYVGNFYVSNRRFQTWTALRNVLQNTNYDLLPLYAMQSVIGVGGGRAFDTLDQKEKYNMVGDRLHTGESAMSYLDRAYLVAAWVINTLV